jgi:hypothetical protein
MDSKRSLPPMFLRQWKVRLMIRSGSEWTKSGYTPVTPPVERQKGYRQITRNPLIFLVEERRIELPTFALRTRRSPS